MKSSHFLKPRNKEQFGMGKHRGPVSFLSTRLESDAIWCRMEEEE